MESIIAKDVHETKDQIMMLIIGRAANVHNEMRDEKDKVKKDQLYRIWQYLDGLSRDLRNMYVLDPTKPQVWDSLDQMETVAKSRINETIGLLNCRGQVTFGVKYIGDGQIKYVCGPVELTKAIAEIKFKDIKLDQNEGWGILEGFGS